MNKKTDIVDKSKHVVDKTTTKSKSLQTLIDEVTKQLNLRTPNAVIEKVIRHYFSAQPKTKLYKGVGAIVSKGTVDTLYKWFNEHNLSSDGFDLSGESIQQKVYKAHLAKMDYLIQKEWSVAYFESLGLNTDDRGWLSTLAVYERDKDNPEITVDFLSAVFRLHLWVSEVTDDPEMFMKLLNKFRADLIDFPDQMPDDAFSIWGILKFQTWRGADYSYAWHIAYDEIRNSDEPYKKMKRKKNFRVHLDLENELIVGGENE